MASSIRHSLSRSHKLSWSSYQRRTFTASKLRHGPGFFNLGATAAAKETQYFSKLSGLGVLNHSPTLEAIKNSEVEPFKKKSGTESTTGDKDSGTKSGLKDSGPYTKIEHQWWIHPTERSQTPETRVGATVEQSEAASGDVLDRLDEKLVSLQSRLRELKQRWDDTHRGADKGHSDAVSRIKADMVVTKFRFEAAMTLLEARSDVAIAKRMQKLRDEEKAKEEKEEEEKEQEEAEEAEQDKKRRLYPEPTPLADFVVTVILWGSFGYLGWWAYCSFSRYLEAQEEATANAIGDDAIGVSYLHYGRPDERRLLIKYKNLDESQDGADALLGDVAMQIFKSRAQYQKDGVLRRWLNSWLWVDGAARFEEYQKETIRTMEIKEAQIKKQLEETMKDTVEGKK
ncbi:hypothetical protein MBLNU457_1787t1 [Dothideomycetes sp. NU457]